MRSALQEEFPTLNAAAGLRSKPASTGDLSAPHSAMSTPVMHHPIGGGMYRSNGGMMSTAPSPPLANMPSMQTQQPQPQQPQQQPLSDRFGLLGLLGVIRMTDQDVNTLALGCDLTSLGMNLNSADPLNPSFVSPWTEQTLDVGVTPVIPDCYRMPQPPPLSTKLPYLSDDSLFFIFYSMPRDNLQESAAQELYNRNWRYHKELKTWLTKEPNAPDSLYTKTAQFEKGVYLFWDVARWCKISKEFVLHYELIEERPSSVGGGSSPAPIGTKSASHSNNGSFVSGLGGLQHGGR